MTASGWEDTEFGTAETFRGNPGVFYSHQYDEQGKLDVIRAARAHIMDEHGHLTVRRIAIHLLETEQPETDTYLRGAQERWLVDASDIIRRAKGIFQAITLS